MRAGTARNILKRGAAIQGMVVDTDGRPIEQASVARAMDDEPPREPPVTLTDARGVFTVREAAPGAVTLLVKAPGFAPAIVKGVAGEAGSAALRVVLGKPAPLRVRVVSTSGHPVPSARLYAESWMGYRLDAWITRTDGNGRAEWPDAPPRSPVVYMVDAEKFAHVRVTLSPADQDQVVTLPDGLTVHGRVTDAGSGAPIAAFQVVPGWEGARDEPPVWQNRIASRGRVNGLYEIELTDSAHVHRIRVEAEGYAPAVSRPIQFTEGPVNIDFQLNKLSASVSRDRSP
jgi:hypothetical protein